MVLASSCTKNFDYNFNEDMPSDQPGGNTGPGGQGGGGQMGDGSADLGELTSFDVNINKVSLSETENIPADDEDFIENAIGSFNDTIFINYSNSSATITGDDAGVAKTNGADVVVNSKKSNVYILSGTTTNGRFKLYSEKKSAIILNGVSITNQTGAAINIQTKKRTFLVVNDGTENMLKDGSTYTIEYENDTTAEKQKGTYYSKSQTIISGKGLLSVYALNNHGICTKDYLRIRKNTNIYVNCTSAEGNCIKCDDDSEGGGITIEGGVLNLDNSATAGKGISSDGRVTINGGRVTAICTGTGMFDTEEQDASGAAGIKSDSLFTLNDGTLYLKSTGAGGKGINGDTDLHFNGGKAYVLTTGGVYSYGSGRTQYTSDPKGIKADGIIYLAGSALMVRTAGTQEGPEGIESKSAIVMSGGDVKVYSTDDCINASSNITITGGSIYAYSTSNDAIDSNGTIDINGGTIFAFGTNQPEAGIDCDEHKFSVTGGTIFGIGGTTSSPTSSSCTQPCYILSNQSVTAGTTYLLSSSSTQILSFSMPRTYSGATILLSCPSFSIGNSYKWGNTSFTISSMVNSTGQRF